MLYNEYPKLEVCKEDIEKGLQLIVNTYKNGGKVLLCGNGGSASDCEHIVGELMKGFRNKRSIIDSRVPEEFKNKLQGSLPAISLPSQIAINTAFINDIDPTMVYAQLVYGYGKQEDLLIGISTSGNAENVFNAMRIAKSLGLKTLALTGEKESKLSGIADVTIKVPETETYKVQELHLPVYHYLCYKVEEEFFK